LRTDNSWKPFLGKEMVDIEMIIVLIINRDGKSKNSKLEEIWEDPL